MKIWFNKFKDNFRQLDHILDNYTISINVFSNLQMKPQGPGTGDDSDEDLVTKHLDNFRQCCTFLDYFRSF